jgi:hypothetical protein
MSKEHKNKKRIENAELKFQYEQLKAATVTEQLDKAVATILQYKAELSQEDFEAAMAQVAERRKEVADMLEAARLKYVGKLQRLGDPLLSDLVDEDEEED